MSLPPYIRKTEGGVTLALKVQPRASANQVVDAGGAELRVKITAPPVDSAANEALIRFLADTLGCARGNVELLRGNTSRHKVVRIHGLDPEVVAVALGRVCR